MSEERVKPEQEKVLDALATIQDLLDGPVRDYLDKHPDHFKWTQGYRKIAFSYYDISPQVADLYQRVGVDIGEEAAFKEGSFGPGLELIEDSVTFEYVYDEEEGGGEYEEGAYREEF